MSVDYSSVRDWMTCVPSRSHHRANLTTSTEIADRRAITKSLIPYYQPSIEIKLGQEPLVASLPIPTEVTSVHRDINIEDDRRPRPTELQRSQSNQSVKTIQLTRITHAVCSRVKYYMQQGSVQGGKVSWFSFHFNPSLVWYTLWNLYICWNVQILLKIRRKL